MKPHTKISVFRMHLHGLIVAIALTAQASVVRSSAEPQGGDHGSEPTTDPALAKLLVGIWKWPWPGGGNDTRIELRTVLSSLGQSRLRCRTTDKC